MLCHENLETGNHPSRQHRLRSDLGTRAIKGKMLEQWQYEVTGAGRIWYCPDDALHVVFITKASTGHRAKLIELMMAVVLVIVSSSYLPTNAAAPSTWVTRTGGGRVGWP